MSQEGYFVNGQGLVVYLKMFKYFCQWDDFLNMAFSWFWKIWVPERLLTNGSMKNGKSALIYYSDTTDTNYSETLVPFRATC